ncbi:hypothetical protein [Spirosoma validum]|uniref:DUF4843 domain-containing protein n=1 Tax=Spirosoma validum TaxID=2771355 RepID=A0A927B7H2_9BACT|nr:hypothetical protein [Spirosoma validum]MBD2756870.1 hypothetical protein [Spirosoma validum]
MIKHLKAYLFLGALSLLVMSCFDNMETVYDGPTVIEFNEAVTRTPAVGRTFPIITANNSVTAGATFVQQLNLVGRQRSSDFSVKVAIDPVNTTITRANTYTLVNDGNVTIPANSSFGSLTLTVSRATSSTSPTGNLVLVIDSTNTDYKASANYKRLGYLIRQ